MSIREAGLEQKEVPVLPPSVNGGQPLRLHLALESFANRFFGKSKFNPGRRALLKAGTFTAAALTIGLNPLEAQAADGISPVLGNIATTLEAPFKSERNNLPQEQVDKVEIRKKFSDLLESENLPENEKQLLLERFNRVSEDLYTRRDYVIAICDEIKRTENEPDGIRAKMREAFPMPDEILPFEEYFPSFVEKTDTDGDVKRMQNSVDSGNLAQVRSLLYELHGKYPTLAADGEDDGITGELDILYTDGNQSILPLLREKLDNGFQFVYTKLRSRFVVNSSDENFPFNYTETRTTDGKNRPVDEYRLRFKSAPNRFPPADINQFHELGNSTSPWMVAAFGDGRIVIKIRSTAMEKTPAPGMSSLIKTWCRVQADYLRMGSSIKELLRPLIVARNDPNLYKESGREINTPEEGHDLCIGYGSQTFKYNKWLNISGGASSILDGGIKRQAVNWFRQNFGDQEANIPTNDPLIRLSKEDIMVDLSVIHALFNKEDAILSLLGEKLTKHLAMHVALRVIYAMDQNWSDMVAYKKGLGPRYKKEAKSPVDDILSQSEALLARAA